MAQKRFILLAEDDEDDQELIQLAFSEVTQDHDFQIVHNGQEVLDVLSRRRDMPCMIILDINMPLLDGIQTLKQLRSEQRFTEIPVVMFTTSDSDDNKRKSYASGAADYFIKPSSMKELVSAAQKMLKHCH